MLKELNLDAMRLRQMLGIAADRISKRHGKPRPIEQADRLRPQVRFHRFGVTELRDRAANASYRFDSFGTDSRTAEISHGNGASRPGSSDVAVEEAYDSGLYIIHGPAPHQQIPVPVLVDVSARA